MADRVRSPDSPDCNRTTQPTNERFNVFGPSESHSLALACPFDCLCSHPFASHRLSADPDRWCSWSSHTPYFRPSVRIRRRRRACSDSQPDQWLREENGVQIRVCFLVKEQIQLASAGHIRIENWLWATFIEHFEIPKLTLPRNLLRSLLSTLSISASRPSSACTFFCTRLFTSSSLLFFISISIHTLNSTDTFESMNRCPLQKVDPNRINRTILVIHQIESISKHSLLKRKHSALEVLFMLNSWSMESERFELQNLSKYYRYQWLLVCLKRVRWKECSVNTRQKSIWSNSSCNSLCPLKIDKSRVVNELTQIQKLIF